MALKRPALSFGHFVFALGGVNTYSSFIKIFEDFSNLKIWIRVDFGGWALGIATIWLYTRYVLNFYVICFNFEWFCEEIRTIGNRDILNYFAK